MLTCLLVFVLLALAPICVLGFRIKDVFSTQYDLNFKLTGYKCQFMGTGVYTVDGLPVNFVRFDSFDEQSYIYVDASVTSVIIDNGSPEYCSNILLGRGVVEKIIVGGKVCVSVNSI